MTAEVQCWCQHCGAELPPDHKGPCPKCGKLGKDFEATLRTTIGLAASLSAQKVHKYTKRHPRFIAVSIVLTVVALILGYLLGNFAGLLIGIIVAILNWWLTPHALRTIHEIRYYGDKQERTQEAKVENNAQQQKGYSHKDIYQKLEGVEKKIDSSSQTQKSGIIYALGAAFVILGLSLWPGFLELIGIGTGGFYVNSVLFIILGFITMFFAYITTRQRKKRRKINGK